MILPHHGRFRVSDLISPDTIELNLKAVNKSDLLLELVSKVTELKNEPEKQKLLLRALVDREELCSTGVGDGVAFPHCRNALVGLVSKPVIVFGRHPTGIAYGSVDENPAKLFFLLLAPTVSQHLQIMARMSRIMLDPKNRKDLLQADSSDKVLKIIQHAEVD